MVCLNCPPSTAYVSDILLSNVRVDPQVRTGDTYHIYVTVKQTGLLLGDYGRVCLYNGSTLIASTGSFYLKPSEMYHHTFTGIMPNHDLILNVSLVDEQIYGFTDCADGQLIQIKVGDHTIPESPIDPEEPNDDQTLQEWIMDNLVLVLMLVLVIIILLKFG